MKIIQRDYPHNEEGEFEEDKNYNRGNKLSGQMRKTALCLTPQAI